MAGYVVFLTVLSLGAWVYLIFFRGNFWRVGETLPREAAARDHWPSVVAIVPARNEASIINTTVKALLKQDYPGKLKIMVVDDQSRDRTGKVAMRAAEASESPIGFSVMAGSPPPAEWTGKLWALSQGVSKIAQSTPDADYYWFTDADIVHSKSCLRRLTQKAEDGDQDLVSLMVKLESKGIWELLLIPPFVYFFKKLYPFEWISNPSKKTAGAAGGCVLIRKTALENAGGIESIRNALIDDCTLADRIKKFGRPGGGKVWLGLTARSKSIRPYSGLSGIWRMVARTAYTQLDHSLLKLLGTVLGMFVVYMVPPLAVASWPLHQSDIGLYLGGTAWLLMSYTFWPTLRLYSMPIWLAPSLPIAAAFYTLMTIDSAFAHWRGKGGEWKGRTQAAH